jgi:hypothetical protein
VLAITTLQGLWFHLASSAATEGGAAHYYRPASSLQAGTISSKPTSVTADLVAVQITPLVCKLQLRSWLAGQAMALRAHRSIIQALSACKLGLQEQLLLGSTSQLEFSPALQQEQCSCSSSSRLVSHYSASTSSVALPRRHVAARDEAVPDQILQELSSLGGRGCEDEHATDGGSLHCKPAGLAPLTRLCFHRVTSASAVAKGWTEAPAVLNSSAASAHT